MKTLLQAFSRVGLLIWLSACAGCVHRTVVIDRQSDVVRLGPDVKGHVYLWQNGQWVKSGKITLPEGWYAGPGPKE